jgi:fucose permease
LFFSVGLFLYVAAEAAIYVWMPTLLASYDGPSKWIATYSISIFFFLRAGGRFLGAWMLDRMSWSAVLTLCSGLILACFAVSMIGALRGAFIRCRSRGCSCR